MKTLSFLLCLLLSIHLSTAQDTAYCINDTILTLIPETTKIIGLGDPSHQEGTITKYRIDLIKKLTKEKDYKILLIEGNMYELYCAHRAFLADSSFHHYEEAMYAMLNASEMEELYRYVLEENQKGNPLLLAGFDATFSGNTFSTCAENMLKDSEILSLKEKKAFIHALEKASKSNFWALFRHNKSIKRDLVYYSKRLYSELPCVSEEALFFKQALHSILHLYSDTSSLSSHTLRDLGMASNVAFIQKMFPNDKIILFGSSTHLLKNPSAIAHSFFQSGRYTLGDELHKNQKEDYYYIAYSALSGYKSSLRNRPVRLAEAEEKSIEFESKRNLKGSATLLTPTTHIIKTRSRFIGNQFLSLELWKVMDMLCLIEEVMPFRIKKR